MGNSKIKCIVALRTDFDSVALDVGKVGRRFEVIGAEVALNVVGLDVVDGIHMRAVRAI